MTASAMEDKTVSCDKKMEANDSLRTLECLRGRLLAERQASRVAKEEEEAINKKLVELENKLREENKLRKKAEKRLKFLMKKLEFLKILPTMEGSEQSSSSENCAFSCTSSTSTSGLKDPEESESKSQSIMKLMSQGKDINAQEIATSNSSQSQFSLPFEENPSAEDASDANSDNALKDSLGKASNNSIPSSLASKVEDYHSSSSLNASVVENETNARNETDNEDYVDNSRALVPVSLAQTTKISELKIINKSVIEVLDALRHAREKIQSSMERRHMIRVGPS